MVLELLGTMWVCAAGLFLCCFFYVHMKKLIK